MLRLRSINRFILIGLVALGSFTADASAAYLYQYTGNQFTTAVGVTTSDRVSVTLTLDAPLAIDLGSESSLVDITGLAGFKLKFASGGYAPAADSPRTNVTAEVATDGDGLIAYWGFRTIYSPYDFGIVGPNRLNFQSNKKSFTNDAVNALPRPYNTTFLGGSVSDNPGTWEISPVPVPAAVWLFGTALIGLLGFSKRRKAA